MSELRRYLRIRYSGVIFISWKTVNGQRNHVLGRILNVSAQGIGLELATRIPKGSFIRVRAYGLTLDGSATVRRVVQRDGVYVLGLELSESLDPNMLGQSSASPEWITAAAAAQQSASM